MKTTNISSSPTIIYSGKKKIGILRIAGISKLLILLMVFNLISLKSISQSLGVQGYCNIITSGHPAGLNSISPCYDELELEFDISNILTDSTIPTALSLKFHPDQVIITSTDFIIDTTTCLSPNIPFTPSTNNVIDTLATVEFATSSPGSCLYSGTWKVRIRIIGCAVLGVDPFKLAFELSTSNSQIFAPGETTMHSPLSAPTTFGQKLEMTLDLINPAVDFIKTSLPNGFQSKDNSVGTKYEVVDRYYKLAMSKGVTDYFTLDMGVEEDAEIMLIEALDGNNSFNSKYTLFDNSQRGQGLHGGSHFQVWFYNPDNNTSTDSLILPPNLVSTSTSDTTSVIGVELGNCLTQNPSNANDNCLYFKDSTQSNYILIHEKLRITKIKNCSFDESQSAYDIKLYCKHFASELPAPTIDTLEYCKEFPATLNIKALLYTSESLPIGQTILDPTGEEYLMLTVTNTPSAPLLDICGNDSIEYGILIKNSSSLITGVPVSSGTIKLEKILMKIDTKHFSFNGIYYGKEIIPVDSNNIDTLANGILQLILPASTLPTLNDPNLTNELLGVTNTVTNGYPDTSRYLYLPPGHQIGITFKDVKFIGCSSEDSSKLKECGKESISLLSEVNVYYRNLCLMDSVIPPPNSPGSGAAINNDNFTGIVTSNVFPQDVGTVGNADSTTHIKASFITTKGNNPWELTSGTFNLIKCPDTIYYAVLHTPSSDYTPLTISYINPLNANDTLETIPENIPSTNDWLIQFPGITDPDIHMEFDIKISCITPFTGVDNFNIEFRATCDNNCSDCYLTYGCTDFSLLRHCKGNCNSAVQTTEFIMKRETFGWASYNDWNLNNAPLASTPDTNVAEFKYYPYDKVKIQSHHGTVGAHAGVQGIAGLSKLYFDLTYSISALPSTTNPLSLINGHFSLYNNDSLSCLPQITVPIENSDVSFIQDTSKSTIRIGVDLLSLIDTTSCAVDTLRDLLRTNSYSIDLDAEFYVNNMQLPPHYYPVASVVGQYTCDSAGVLLTSCDPYIKPFTYLQLKIDPTDRMIGALNWTKPDGNTHTLNQCEFLYQFITSVSGGYPDADDFPGEYRPILIYPDTFGIISNDATWKSGYMIKDSCENAFTFNSPHYDITYAGCNYNAVAKTVGNNQRSQFIFTKECANTVHADSIIIRNLNIAPFAYTNIYDSLYASDSTRYLSFPSPVKYSDSTDTYRIGMDFFPAIEPNYIGLKNPSDSIDLNLSFIPTPNINPSQATILPNCYVYFTGLASSTDSMSVILYDVDSSRVINPNPIGAYIINNVPIAAYKRHFKLIVSWNKCHWSTTPISSYDTLRFNINVSNICSGYSNLTSLTGSSCYTETKEFKLLPEVADVDILPLANAPITTQVIGCADFTHDFNVISSGSALTSALLTIKVPVGIKLRLSDCTIGGIQVPDSSGGPKFFYFLSHVISNSDFDIYQFQLTNYVTPGSLVKDSNLLVHLVAYATGIPAYPSVGQNSFSFIYGISAKSGCGDSHFENNATANFDYDARPSITITPSAFEICSDNTSSSPLTLTATYTGGATVATYNWTNQSGNGDTSLTPYIFNIWYPGGTYSVSSQDSNGCDVSASITLKNKSDLHATSAVACAGANAILAVYTTATSPSYLWSDSSTTSSINPIVSSLTTYTVTVTDSITGCVELLSADVGVNSATCCGTYPALRQANFDVSGTIGGNYVLNESVLIKPGKNISLAGHIVIGAGVNIIIEGTATDTSVLNLGDVTLETCGTMWQGIVAKNYSTVSIENATIKQANAAIEVRGHHSKVNINSGDFENCVRGIYYSQSGAAKYTGSTFNIKRSNFLATSSGFETDYLYQPEHGSIPYCGIEISSMIASIGTGTYASDKNTFDSLYRGIVIRDAIVSVKSALFNNIMFDGYYAGHSSLSGPIYYNCALYSNGNSGDNNSTQLTTSLEVNGFNFHDVKIENSSCGIYSINGNLEAQNVVLMNVRKGIAAHQNYHGLTAKIRYCTISATQIGIDFHDNVGADLMEAEHNSIFLSGSNLLQGIKVTELNRADAHYNIKDNVIDITPGTGKVKGIRLDQVENGIFEHNSIFFREPSVSSTSKSWSGIESLNSLHSNIECNTVTNQIADFTNTYGLYSSLSEGNTIECNGFTQTGTGAFFGGTNALTNFKTNEMTSNITGLEINSTGEIGPQNQNGNEWEGYQGNFGAIITTSAQNAILSRFEVNTMMNDINSNGRNFYPTIDTTLDQIWFFTDFFGTPTSCLGLLGIRACLQSVSMPDDVLPFERLIAIDSINYDVYNAEARNQARMYLYKRLLTDSVLLNSDTIYSNFMSAYDTSAIGQLSELDVEISNASVFSSSYYYQINLVEHEIDRLTDSLLTLIDPYLYPAGLYDSLENQILKLQIEHNLLIAVVNNNESAKNKNLSVLNDLVSPAETPEKNKNRINSYYFGYKAEGLENLKNHQDSILAIALQCPFKGGEAVYQARALLELLTDSIPEYDDVNTCLEQGIYRIGKFQENLSFTLQPNPTDEEVLISMILSEETIKSIQIYDLAGKLLVNHTYSDRQRSQMINTKAFSPGIYLVQLQNEMGYTATKKLVIVH